MVGGGRSEETRSRRLSIRIERTWFVKFRCATLRNRVRGKPNDVSGTYSAAFDPHLYGQASTACWVILEGSQAIQSASFIDEKKNSADLVTEYDVAVENLVMTETKNAYPTFQL